MSIVFKILQIIIVFVLGFLLTTRAIPWVFIKVMRLFGFSMTLTPVMEKRVKRFKSIKRGYYSFVITCTLLVISLFLEIIINHKAVLIYYNGNFSAPAVMEWLNNVIFFKNISSFNSKEVYGQMGKDEVDYLYFKECVDDPEILTPKIKDIESQLEKLKPVLATTPPENAPFSVRNKYKEAKRKSDKFEKELSLLKESYDIFKQGKAWVVMPVYPYSPNKNLLDEPGTPPHRPSWKHPLGTDDAGYDILTQLCYGFRISLFFALIVAAVGDFIGVIVGGIMGYYGGWIDILVQRFIEIWSSIPFLYSIMILASITHPTFFVMVIFLVILNSWLGITYMIRGEFYREKAKDYVQAAIAIGSSDWKVIIKHILPNSLVPIVSSTPFGIVAYISSLVALDYLGYGLPTTTPSWGRLLQQGLKYIVSYPHLIIVPTTALALTLFAVVIVGEAVREAFDPKVFSRLR